MAAMPDTQNLLSTSCPRLAAKLAQASPQQAEQSQLQACRHPRCLISLWPSTDPSLHGEMYSEVFHRPFLCPGLAAIIVQVTVSAPLCTPSFSPKFLPWAASNTVMFVSLGSRLSSNVRMYQKSMHRSCSQRRCPLPSSRFA